MINTRKSFKVIITKSNNPLEDLQKPIKQRLGFASGKTPIYPIYFYRYIGINNNEKKYYDDIDSVDSKLSSSMSGYERFIDHIPVKAISQMLVAKTQNIWNSLNSGNYSPMSITNTLISTKVLPSFSNALLTEAIKSSLENILSLYINNEHVINPTKIKNFSLKILSWIEGYLPKLFKTINIENNNPKVMYYGDIKKHEIYFLIFLSQIGIDILYINSMTDSDFSVIDKNGIFSRKLEFPLKKPLRPFSKKPVSSKTNRPVATQRQPVSKVSSTPTINTRRIKRIDISTADKINTKPKTAHDLLDEFTKPLSERSGFIGGNSPIIPVYFYRYIGIDTNVDSYYNKLYRLNKKLSNGNYSYIKFENNVPLVNKPSLVNKCKDVWTTIDANTVNSSVIIDNLYACGAFQANNNKTIANSFINAISEMLKVYLANEGAITIQKLKNFVMKQLLWLDEYGVKLASKFDATNIKGTTFNPKVIYYGNIKQHEAYFLLMLSKLGFDIMYINTENDSAFSSIDPDCKYSYLIEFADKKTLKSFPEEEVLIRTETTAFKASNELSDIIYTETDGIYKPWQFESYETKPLTLKTTIDEVKLLWREEARMRTGFKVENKTVYIPNLFVKISGVYEDISIYWNDVSTFKNSENTIFYSNLPFTTTQYTRESLYKCAYILDSEGFVDKDKLFSSPLYKFSYLRTHLQELIVHKINQLFVLPIFKNEINKDYKLKIIISILTMDKQILNLIQNFDYPFKVPKIVIYDNNESMFNDQDIAVLSFLNLFGFDILILTPTGYNNIENAIKSKYYDIHKLQKVQFDLQLPNLNNKSNKKSFWSSLFGRP
ncbi:YceG family protein [Clostridiaceae bacterium M8S5]|nr:YceG family protein [Clostridiaceae bacterium M8S5]